MEREAPVINEADQPALKKQKTNHATPEANSASTPVVPSIIRNLDEKNLPATVDNDQLNFLQDKQYFDSYAHLVKKKSKKLIQLKLSLIWSNNSTKA